MALLLTVFSILLLSIRYLLQFIFSNTYDFSTPFNVAPGYAAVFVIFGDLIPIVIQMVCIWMTYKGEWDVLVTHYLHAPNAEDKTTDCGSVMLDQFRADLSNRSFEIHSSGVKE